MEQTMIHLNVLLMDATRVFEKELQLADLMEFYVGDTDRVSEGENVGIVDGTDVGIFEYSVNGCDESI